MQELTKEELLKIMRMRHALRATYLLWRLGVSPRYILSRETYYRHKTELLEDYQTDINKPFKKE